MSQLAQFSQFNLQKPFKVSDDYETQASQLADDGIRFEQWPIISVLPNAMLTDADFLKLYESKINEIKEKGNYAFADIASLKACDAFSISIRGRYLSEHCHSEDEVRFILEGSVLVYIHINERIHILQCGKGDFIIIPKGVKHWLDIGPNPEFTSIRWFKSKDGLENNFTGSCVAEATPRWETIYGESHFKR